MARIGRSSFDLGSPHADTFFAYSRTRPQDGVTVTGWMTALLGTPEGNLSNPLPPGEDVHVGNVPLLLRDDVAPGTSIDLELVSGHDSIGVGPYRMVSEITHRDAAIFALDSTRKLGSVNP